MRRVACALICLALTAGMLSSCGTGRSAAPLAENMQQVQTALTAMPDGLDDMEILAKASSIVFRAIDGTQSAVFEYHPGSGAYRRMVPPVEGDWTLQAAAPAPDGSLWSAINTADGWRLLKSTQGKILYQSEAVEERPEAMVCDSVGHVFVASTHTIRRYSPEGTLQGTLILTEEDKSSGLGLAACRDRVFLRISHDGRMDEYVELLPDMTTGESFEACIHGQTVQPIGSFLQDYLVMEADSVGLYAYREKSGWETVCLWADRDLNGVIDSRLLCDSSGYGVLRYEERGRVYCLCLAPYT